MKRRGEPSRAKGIREDSSLLESVLKNKRPEAFLLLPTTFLASPRQRWDFLCPQLALERGGLKQEERQALK